MYFANALWPIGYTLVLVIVDEFLFRQDTSLANHLGAAFRRGPTFVGI